MTTLYIVRYKDINDCEVFVDAYLAHVFAKKISSTVETIYA